MGHTRNIPYSETSGNGIVLGTLCGKLTLARKCLVLGPQKQIKPFSFFVAQGAKANKVAGDCWMDLPYLVTVEFSIVIMF